MSGRLIYEQEHMDEISLLYKQAAERIESAYNSLNTAGQNIDLCYQGNGITLFDEAGSTIYQHIKFLETCATALSVYVEKSYESLSTTDDAISNRFNSTSTGQLMKN